MSNAKIELVRSWLIKADHDLKSAHELAVASEPLLDTAIYHCQQAAEKAIKGLLVYKDIRFDKTHDIDLLISLAVDMEPRLSSWSHAAELLTPYATEFRYPGEYAEPEPAEFEEAFVAAKNFYAFILTLLPQEVHPGRIKEFTHLTKG